MKRTEFTCEILRFLDNEQRFNSTIYNTNIQIDYDFCNQCFLLGHLQIFKVHVIRVIVI